MTEDYADYLSEEANSSNAAVHEFITGYNTGAEEIHVFFEGEKDFTYYLPLIRAKTVGADIVPYNCGGKWNVVEARDQIEDAYDAMSLFFVDRDYDDYLGRQPKKTARLYITDGYSVESDLSRTVVIKIVLQDVLALKRPDVERLSIDIHRRINTVMRRMRSLSGWILAAKEGGCNPNLNNTNSLNGIIAASEAGNLTLGRDGFRNFKKRVFSGSEPTHADQVRWCRTIRHHDDYCVIRGKYLGWILCKAIHLALLEENARRKVAKVSTIHIPDSIAGCRIVELLGGRIPCPASLASFLEACVSEHLMAA